MADRKISDLTALTTPASGDYVPIVDISEVAAASKNKRITIEELFQGIPVNVGIGTTSPAVPLDIVGQVRTTDSTVDLRLLPLAASNVGIVGTFSNHALSFFTNDTERLRIDPSGNVGIGTSSPVAPLTVSNGTVDLVLSPFSTEGYIGTATNHAVPFITNNQERARIDSGGRLLVGTSSSVDDTFGASSIQVSTTGGNAASFSRYSADAFAPIVYLKKSRGALGAQGIVLSGDNVGSLLFTGSDGVGFIQAATIKAEVDGTPGTNDMPGRLVFSTTADGAASPTERVRIDSSGNVGIGTSSPTTLLDVNADTVRVRTARTPASASATGATGEICWDANYIYVCTATNTWKRSALSTW